MPSGTDARTNRVCSIRDGVDVDVVVVNPSTKPRNDPSKIAKRTRHKGTSPREAGRNGIPVDFIETGEFCFNFVLKLFVGVAIIV